MKGLRKNRRLNRLLLVGCLLVSGFSLRAADFLRMESAYLGDGWFEYRVRLVDDPFYETASLGAISVSFPGRVEYGVDPAGWLSSMAGMDKAIWNSGMQQGQLRPYERTFLARSTHRTFKTVDQAAQITYTATSRSGLLPAAQAGQIAGLLSFRALVPCPPEDADGSAAQQSSSQALRDDLRISSLTIENGVPTKLSYEWPHASTVSLEASSDLENWTSVTTIEGVAGMTTWDATVALENFGRFYRLILINHEESP